MNQIDILYPVFVQALLTLVVGGMMAVARARAIATMDRQRGNPDLARGKTVWPEDAAKRAANYSNQFELPVLFYAVVAFALIAKGADLLMIVLAWLFVISRYAHSFVHVTSNRLRYRAPLFAIGFALLVCLWGWLAIWLALE